MLSFPPAIHLPSCPIKVTVPEDGSVLSKVGLMCGAAVIRKCLEYTVLISTSSHLLPSPSERNHSLTAQLFPDVFCIGEKIAKAIYGQSDTVWKKEDNKLFLLISVFKKIPVQKVR